MFIRAFDVMFDIRQLMLIEKLSSLYAERTARRTEHDDFRGIIFVQHHWLVRQTLVSQLIYNKITCQKQRSNNYEWIFH